MSKPKLSKHSQDGMTLREKLLDYGYPALADEAARLEDLLAAVRLKALHADNWVNADDLLALIDGDTDE